MTAKPALLLVDVQRDYLERDALSPPRDLLETALAGLLDHARNVRWPVLHVQTLVSADGHDAMPHWRTSGRSMCVAGTDGAKPPPRLSPLDDEPVFPKRFYSGFENPELLPYLRGHGIDTLVIAGVHTHACVRSTALDAYAHGLRTFIATDCVASYDSNHAQQTLDWLSNRAAVCLTSSDIIGQLDAAHREPVDRAKWLHRSPVDWSIVLDEVELSRQPDIQAAADSIAAVQDSWQDVPLPERTSRISAWGKAVARDRSLWVDALIREVGKPRMDAEGEVSYALALLQSVGAQLADDAQAEGGRVRYRPHGTVALITPWNNPFAIPIGKIAPALGYGNTVLWKPALPASALAQAMHRSLAEVGLDRYVGVVTGDAETGRLLASWPRVRAVSVTGSIAVGRELAQTCGQLMRPLQAELGGNNAAIVLADADIKNVARDLASAMFSFAGQRCTAIRRVIVVSEIYDAFEDALRSAVTALSVGPPDDPRTQVGPVISKERQSEFLAAIEQGLASGGRVLTGGGIPPGLPQSGCWLLPTVMTDLPANSPIVNREMFGPLVALLRAKDFDEALSLHNRGEHGLLGSLFSNKPEAKERFLREAEAGLLVVNQARPAFAGSGPFVGWKASGFGPPEHGRWNRDFYTRVQAAYLPT